MKYFDHDTSACFDTGIEQLRCECGGAAVDAYWAIIETIYREEKPLSFSDFSPSFSEFSPSFSMFAHRLYIKRPSNLKKWVKKMVEIGLLEETENGLVSQRAMQKIADYQALCEKNAKNGRKGGRPKKQVQETQTVSGRFDLGTQAQSDRKANRRERIKKKGILHIPLLLTKAAQKRPRRFARRVWSVARSAAFSFSNISPAAACTA